MTVALAKRRGTAASPKVFVRKGGVNKPWFDARLADRDISQRGLARLLELDASAVSLMLNGKRQMSAAEAAEVARLLGVPVEEVMRHAGIPVPIDQARAVPIVGSVDELGRVQLGRQKGPQSAIAPPDVGKGCQALRVHTPGAMAGWLVFYRPSSGVSLEAVGRICIVQAAGEDGSCLRRVERGYESGWHTLHGLGLRMGEPAHVQLVSASPVLWMRQ